jgi:hypothetical protein
METTSTSVVASSGRTDILVEGINTKSITLREFLLSKYGQYDNVKVYECDTQNLYQLWDDTLKDNSKPYVVIINNNREVWNLESILRKATIESSQYQYFVVRTN